MDDVDPRASVTLARRVVVKIGSSAVAADGLLESLAEAVASRVAASFVVVSSGAIELGSRRLGYRANPSKLAKRQAAAAAGQSLLTYAYETAFTGHGLPVAQILLTHADLADSMRWQYARQTLAVLIDAGVVVILNENDSVAVDELRFGDNNQLAAMVVQLVDADLLVFLDAEDGLLDRQGARLPTVRDVATEAVPLLGSMCGQHRLANKVEAARRATLAGANVVIADARTSGIFQAVLAGEDVGTLFVARPGLGAKEYRIAFTLHPRGDIILNLEAAQRLAANGSGVGPSDVLAVRGDFQAGDAVRVVDPSGRELARGLARSSAGEAAAVAGRSQERVSLERVGLELLIRSEELLVGVGIPAGAGDLSGVHRATIGPRQTDGKGVVSPGRRADIEAGR